MRVRFLGTSTSYGVPVIGCRCPTCTSTDPRNKRTRASVYVESDEGARLLIDTGPELRLQALREGITHVDAVLYTHLHADHTAGIDDLKAFNAALGGVLPCFGDAATGASLRERFAYAFAGTPWIGLIPHIGYTDVDVEPVLRRQDVHSADSDAARLDPRDRLPHRQLRLPDRYQRRARRARARCCTTWRCWSSTPCAGSRTRPT